MLTLRIGTGRAGASLPRHANNIAFQEIVMTYISSKTTPPRAPRVTPINWDTAEARVKDLKAYLMNAPSGYGPRAAAVPERGV